MHENEVLFSFELKELRKHNRIIFVSTTKMGGNTINILNCYF